MSKFIQAFVTGIAALWLSWFGGASVAPITTISPSSSATSSAVSPGSDSASSISTPTSIDLTSSYAISNSISESESESDWKWTLISVLDPDSTDYSVSDGQVFYSKPDGHDIAIAGADPGNFQVAYSSNADSDLGYAKDQHSVYNSGLVISGADPSSFSPVLDPSGFASGFSKDRSSVYFDTTRIPGADPATLVVISAEDSTYAKDENHVYLADPNDTVQVISGADPATFKLVLEPVGKGRLPTDYTEDAKHVYFDGALISGADVATFSVVDFGDDLSKDAHAVYWKSEVLTGADSTFRELTCSDEDYPCGTYVDKTHVYFASDTGPMLIPGADPATFKAFLDEPSLPDGQIYDGQDKNNYYFGTNIVD